MNGEIIQGRAASVFKSKITETTWLLQIEDTMGCEVPASLQPLFNFLDTLVQLMFFGGIFVATFGFLAAGILFMIPGEEYNRRAKQVAKNTLIGTILLLSANMIVGFLVSQLGTALCT